MNIKKSLLVISLCAVPALLADDYTPLSVKPGLWETTVNNSISGAPPIPADVLSKMTPEQRARVEAAMKGRGSSGRASTYCMTPDSMKKAVTFNAERQGCTSKLLTSTSSMQDVQIDCAQGEQKSTGEMQVQALDSEHVKGQGHFKASMGGAGGTTIDISFTSKWVSSDCGAVKPK